MEVYTKYFYKPTAMAHPHAAGPAAWFFVNVVVRNSEAALPLPAAPVATPCGGSSSQRGPGAASGAARDEEALEEQGLAVPLPLCTVGYHFGGDGHAILKVKLMQAGAQAVLPWGAGPHTKQLLEPFSADVGVSWHRPATGNVNASMLQLSATPLTVKLGFAHTGLLQAALSLLGGSEPPPASTPASTAATHATGPPTDDLDPSLPTDAECAAPGAALSQMHDSLAEAAPVATVEELPPSTSPLPQRLQLQKAVVQVRQAWLFQPLCSQRRKTI